MGAVGAVTCTRASSSYRANILCVVLLAGPDAEEVQAEAEEVIIQREGQWVREPVLQRPAHLSCVNSGARPQSLDLTITRETQIQ